jgi:hypothetical protein
MPFAGATADDCSRTADKRHRVAIRLPVVTATTGFDNLVMTETATGHQIDGFIDGKTQARIVFNRRGEQLEIVCVTEALACMELATAETLSGWELVSATLEPLAKWSVNGTDGLSSKRSSGSTTKPVVQQ